MVHATVRLARGADVERMLLCRSHKDRVARSPRTRVFQFFCHHHVAPAGSGARAGASRRRGSNLPVPGRGRAPCYSSLNRAAAWRGAKGRDVKLWTPRSGVQRLGRICLRGDVEELLT